MTIWRLFRLLCLILLALLFQNRAWADEGVCDPAHLPRPQRYTFTERGVEAVVEVRAICWREEWSVSMHVDLLVKEGEIVLPPNVRAFDELGYRRYEWKCDNHNEPSKRAALRYGFTYEGLFRQATIYKGRSRDTAWYSILDREFPAIARAFTAWLAATNFDASGRQVRRLPELLRETRHA